MDAELIEGSLRLFAATTAGGLIGLERAYNGRAAGFRTHVLVCLASALLMLLMQFQWLIVPSSQIDTLRVDPTRMAQGIMTGIGFLGAGVILHDKRSIRGLTTAASIWITSAIGIIIGSGLYAIGILAVALTLITLSLFRWVEKTIPTRRYAKLAVVAEIDVLDIEGQIKELLKKNGLEGNGFAYTSRQGGHEIQLQTTISTFKSRRFKQLYQALCQQAELREFTITPLDN
ncbi:MgtC/SapB family protein [Aurantivibrio plasticivorans]